MLTLSVVVHGPRTNPLAREYRGAHHYEIDNDAREATPATNVIAAHLAAAAEINLSCQPLTDRPTAKLFNLRSNSPRQRPMQPTDSTYLPKHTMPIYSKL